MIVSVYHTPPPVSLRAIVRRETRGGAKPSPILNIELRQPGAKTIGKYPMTPRGLKREFEHYPGNARTTLVYLELAPDPSGSLASVP